MAVGVVAAVVVRDEAEREVVAEDKVEAGE